MIENGKLFAVKRAYGNESVIHKYEFVGGKIQNNETPQQALVRECLEELDMQVEVGALLGTVVYEYPEIIVNLSIYLCKRLSDFMLKEHELYRWIDCNHLNEDEWAPADREFIIKLKQGNF